MKAQARTLRPIALAAALATLVAGVLAGMTARDARAHGLAHEREAEPVEAPYYCDYVEVTDVRGHELALVVNHGEIVCEYAELVVERWINRPVFGDFFRVGGVSWFCHLGGHALNGARVARNVGLTCIDGRQRITAYIPASATGS